jgi:hypothetical protein
MSHVVGAPRAGLESAVRWVAVSRRRLGVVRGLEAAAAVAPRAAHAVRGAAEAGDQLAGAAAGGAGAGVVLGHEAGA